MAVVAACGDDHALTGQRLGARANDDVYTGLDIGVASLADGANTAILNANIGLDDAPMVYDQRIGNHQIDSTLSAAALALTHAIAYGFATAKFDFFSIA